MQHIVQKNRIFPFFDLVRVWNPQLQREHTDWSPNLFCPPQLWIFYMHILHFLNLSLVCSNLENFTCTYHTFSTFSFSICSNCPSLYEAWTHLFWRKTWFVWGIDMWQRNKLKAPGHHCDWPHIEGKTLVGRYSRHFCHVLPVKVDSGQSTNWTFHTLHRPANIEHWKTFDALIGCAGTVSLNFVTSSRGMLWRANNFLQNMLG